MIDGFACPEVRPGHEPLDLRVHYEARLPQVVHEGLPHAYATFRTAFTFFFRQRAAESVAFFRKPGVAHDDVGALATHVLDDVAARGPQVGKAGYIGLQRESFDAAIANGVDEIEAVPVAAVEMDTDSGGAVGRCRKGQCLADTTVFPGSGDKDSLSSKGGVICFTKFEFAYIRRERHGVCLRQLLRSLKGTSQHAVLGAVLADGLKRNYHSR